MPITLLARTRVQVRLPDDEPRHALLDLPLNEKGNPYLRDADRVALGGLLGVPVQRLAYGDIYLQLEFASMLTSKRLPGM